MAYHLPDNRSRREIDEMIAKHLSLPEWSKVQITEEQRKVIQDIDRARKLADVSLRHGEHVFPAYMVRTSAPSARKKPKTPTNTGLKAFLEAKKQESVILGDVARFLQLKADDRATHVIHPSEMARKDWCARATWLRLTGHTKKETHSLRSELIFGEGREIHSKWQGWFQEMGILYGDWACLACETKITGHSTALPKIGCKKQMSGTHIWRYGEVGLRDKSVNVAGHADGIIGSPTGDFLVEIKSVGPGTLRKLNIIPTEMADEDAFGQFSRITHILGEHYRQIQAYLKMSQDSDYPVDRAVAIYEQKADQQVREFVIEYDPDAMAAQFSTAADIMWAISKGREIACSNGTDCAQCRGWEPNA